MPPRSRKATQSRAAAVQVRKRHRLVHHELARRGLPLLGDLVKGAPSLSHLVGIAGMRDGKPCHCMAGGGLCVGERGEASKAVWGCAMDCHHSSWCRYLERSEQGGTGKTHGMKFARLLGAASSSLVGGRMWPLFFSSKLCVHRRYRKQTMLSRILTRAALTAGQAKLSSRSLIEEKSLRVCSRLLSSGSSGAGSSHPSGLTLWGDGKGTGLEVPPSREAYFQEVRGVAWGQADDEDGLVRLSPCSTSPLEYLLAPPLHLCSHLLACLSRGIGTC